MKAEGEHWKDAGARLRRAISVPELAICDLLLIAIVVLTAGQVVLRYVFNAPVSWSEELSGVLVVWLTFLGAAGLSRKGLHARAALLAESGAMRVAAVFDLVFDVLIVVFAVYLVVSGVELIQILTFERTPALRMPIGYQIAAVPVAACLMALYHGVWAVRRIRRIIGAPDAA